MSKELGCLGTKGGEHGILGRLYHELRSPLTAILRLADLLSEGEIGTI
jgi:hypothetical protein